MGLSILFIYFRYLDKAYVKDNYPTSFTCHIIDEYLKSDMFFLMDEVLRYNQIQTRHDD